ncbi:MAG: glycoside hydrolase family 125 protein [Chloroflexaceae bacterium]|jgi:hypothetical protein|nr:glycoside hydrolase family 125 protein [Chloroflexaceae bacterium]
MQTHEQFSTTAPGGIAGIIAPTVDGAIAAFERHVGVLRPAWAEAFRQCFPNTLATTTELCADGTTFVFTGDIPAMWLRDSSAQVRPYVRFAGSDPTVRRMIAGLIRRQAHYLVIDAYANAFNREPNGKGHQGDRTRMGPWLWERKFELDSLCYPIQLCQDYFTVTGDESVFDETLHQALWRIVGVMQTEQRHQTRSAYSFERSNCPPSDTLPEHGRGSPVSYTGMVWSGFRPSDDACTYGYHIPSNMFAVVVLEHLAHFAERFYRDGALAERAAGLRANIEMGIQTYGLVEHPRHGRIYAYETDGMGNHNLMDDANVPSLLSIPYLGYRPADDPTYLRTRAFVLSRDNPYFVAGRVAQGVGSPHTPAGYVWPIGIAMQGLTATDRAEQQALLEMLVETTAGTGYMHESFDPNEPSRYTRPWFAWANSMFGELAYRWARLDERDGKDD